MSVRALGPAELWDMDTRSLIMWSMEVESAKYLPKIVDKLTKSIVGFHIKRQGDNLVAHNDPIPIHVLPKGYKNLKDLSNDFIKRNYLDYDKAFAMIGCNDTQISMVINHMCADGGYIRYQMEHILDENPKLHPLPLITANFFKKEIENAPSDVHLWSSEPNVTRLLPRRKACHDKGVDTAFPDYFTIETTKEKLQCYEKGKIRGYSEYLWLAHVFSALAFNGHMQDIVGVTTCVDLRNWLPKNVVDYNLTNGFSAITPSSVLKPDMTLREIGEQLRRDMNRRIKRGEQFGFLKGLDVFPEAEEIPGACLEISNAKNLIQKKPIIDTWIGLSLKDPSNEQILSAMSFSTEGYGKNQHIIRLRYGPVGLSKSDMKIFGKSFDHFMHHVSLNRKAQDVFEEMKAFQNSVK